MEDVKKCPGETESCTTTPGVNSDKVVNDPYLTTSWSNGSNSSDVTLGLPLGDQVVLIVLYTLTTTLSVVGNVLAIIVFAAGRRSRTDLRWFLINLAVADLVMAMFCMPFTFTMTMLGQCSRIRILCLSHGLLADSVDASLASLSCCCTAVNAVFGEVYAKDVCS